METHVTDSILEMITEHATNERLDNIILADEKYISIQAEMDKLTNELDSLNLTQKQKTAVNDLIAENIAIGCYYTRAAYQQGFKDCVSLLREIGIIR